MKVVILAGGLGTRLSEETVLKPKPMVDIGGMPILWHIMKHYSYYGFNDFVICLGYKGYVIKEFFANYFLHSSNITFDLKNNKMQVLNSETEPWKVTLVDTGLNTMTGGRVKRVQDYIGDEPFMLTYGDGVSDINLHELIKFHHEHGKIGTMSSFLPEGRFGIVEIGKNNDVLDFHEKPQGDGGWINIGFFVFQPEIFNYLTGGDNIIFEHEPLERLAHDNQLKTAKHHGFWKCMDTIKDRIKLEELWSNHAPWKIWE